VCYFRFGYYSETKYSATDLSPGFDSLASTVAGTITNGAQTRDLEPNSETLFNSTIPNMIKNS
jgi:hypothetical protein